MVLSNEDDIFKKQTKHDFTFFQLFLWFNSHDWDMNTKMDGLELFKALRYSISFFKKIAKLNEKKVLITPTKLIFKSLYLRSLML